LAVKILQAYLGKTQVLTPLILTTKAGQEPILGLMLRVVHGQGVHVKNKLLKY
jgi:hypothetical protein